MKTTSDVGQDLARLREELDVSQARVAAWAGTHQPVVSGWDAGRDLHLLPRYVRGLVGALGPAVWRIAGDACLAVMEHDEDRDSLAPIVAAVVTAMTDLTSEGRDMTERQEGPTWRLRRMPSLEEIAVRLGRTPPFDALTLKNLGDLIYLTRFVEGWGEEIETDAERHRRVRRLEAELESLRA